MRLILLVLLPIEFSKAEEIYHSDLQQEYQHICCAGHSEQFKNVPTGYKSQKIIEVSVLALSLLMSTAALLISLA